MVEGLGRGAGNSEFFVKSYLVGRLTSREEKKSLGDWSDGGTPGPIPNPVVKPVSADGTWGAAPWESRSLPRDFFLPIRTSLQKVGVLIECDAL